MPIIQITENGFKTAMIFVTTSNTFLNEDGNKITGPMNHRCKASGKLAHIIEKFLVEGMEVAVEGSLIQVATENSNRSVESYIQISDLLMLGKLK
jgi:single-strand DNA-binding protein